MSRRAAVAIAVVVAVLAGGAGAGWYFFNREPALPTGEVTAYLQAWERFDAEGMQRLTAGAPPELAELVTSMHDDLRATGARFQRGPLRRDGERVLAGYGAEVDLAGLGMWTYEGQLELRRTDGDWRVVWSPAALHPDLAPGQRFDRSRSWPVRAPILGVDGTPLVGEADVVDIGLVPERITNRAQVQAVLQQQLGIPPADVTAALTAPGVQPNHFVPVARVRRERFTEVDAVLRPVPGIVFDAKKGRMPVADDFALHVLGRYDEVTAERLDQLGAPYLVGDFVGLSGLEAAFERRLAGTPSGEVQAVDVATEDKVATLFQFTGTAPEPLGTTLDRRTQAAAEQALAGVTAPAALVALDAGTGDVRAVVSRPFSEPFNRALAGTYPPASTFKVVTTAALLAAGTTPNTPVACPATATVGGQTFRNFEGGALGGTTFRSAFAQSCNTAFVALSANLSDAALASAAQAFGFGAQYDLGLPTEGGTYPTPKDVAQRASQAIGQGDVEASPLHMASVAAAVASGGWRAPRLLTDKLQAPTTMLDPATVATLRDLTAEVVRTGTGTAAAVAGQQIGGKTGTAETDEPDRTHAWFIGYRGSLAFAVLVQGGGVGGRVAAPLAARFLAAAP
ncbi:MAG TPA: penicillin-binding transpeptidase domain-containing protein [Acidimicrobiales bacterium]|nr:penicillin-binding transpeptidase domain-containing protein [Acidimicrobiales bacterium]